MRPDGKAGVRENPQSFSTVHSFEQGRASEEQSSAEPSFWRAHRKRLILHSLWIMNTSSRPHFFTNCRYLFEKRLTKRSDGFMVASSLAAPNLEP
jgi:hypothetical protein